MIEVQVQSDAFKSFVNYYLQNNGTNFDDQFVNLEAEQLLTIKCEVLLDTDKSLKRRNGTSMCTK